MKRGFTALAALFLFLARSAFAQAQEMDPLLKILVENKVITMEQALSVQAEYARRQQASAVAPAPAAARPAVTQEEVRQIAQEETAKAKANLPDALKDLKIGATLFLSYQVGNSYDSTKPLVNGQYPETHYSQFVLKRGYLDVEKKVTEWLDVRYTPDVRQDSTGSWGLRTKFLYGRFHWKGNALFAQPYVMAGSIPTPFIDFEESVYGFRAQDTNFIDRAGVMTSADLGVAGGFNLGPELPESYRKEVSSKFAGRYGSFMGGLFNGGGYDAAEKNTNKVAMARLSVRPFPDQIPGFQVTLFGGTGKGNTADTAWATSGAYKGRRIYPGYRMFLGMLTYEHRYFAAYAQWFNGCGGRSGSAQNVDYTAKEEDGYSFFAKVHFPANKKLTAFARYDSFDTDTRLANGQADETERWIGGLAWNLYKSNFLLLDYDSLRHSLPTLPDEDRWQLTLQLKF